MIPKFSLEFLLEDNKRENVSGRERGRESGAQLIHSLRQHKSLLHRVLDNYLA